MINVILWPLISIVLWLLLAGFFSGAETGLYSINKFRLGAKAVGGDGNALRLRRLLSRPGDLICTLLVGANLSIYAATAQCTGLIDSLGGWPSRMLPAIITTVVLTPAVLVLAEMIPKEVFRRRSETLPYSVSRSILVFSTVFKLPVFLLGGVVTALEKGLGLNWKKEALLFSRQDLADLISVGAREGVISPYQADMAHRIMKLKRVKLNDVMIPLQRITMVEEDTSVDTFLDMAEGRRHSRIPVFDMNRTNIIGAVNIFDIFYWPERGKTVTDYVEPLITMPRDTIVSNALTMLQKEKRVMALVVDDENIPAGVVTIKDLVEEIAGELPDW